jgi:cellulose biosynthesis protein BcsQ
MKVGIADFDVDAPSMHIHMKDVLPANFVIDDYSPDILTLLRTDSDLLTPRTVEEASIRLELPLPNASCILLPCFGRENDLEELEPKWRLKDAQLDKIFEMFGNSYDLDFLLIDSRTGYSQQAMMTAFSAREVVAVSRADKVSINGMQLVLGIFKHRRMKVHLLITSIPDTVSPNDKRLRSFVQSLDQGSDSIITPYVPDWYFGGQVIWKQTKHNKSVIAPFNELAEKLIGGEK